MGLEAKIGQMNPKFRKLLENLFTVGIICMIAYMFFAFANAGGNYMSFMQSSEFLTGVVVLIAIGFGWKLIRGGRLQIPNQPGQRPRTPEKAPVQKKPKLMKDYKKTIRKPQRGSWYCSSCGRLVVGDICYNCGSRRQLRR